MQHVIRCFDRFEDLPERYHELRTRLASKGLFGQPGWFALLMSMSFHDQDRLCLLAVESAPDGRPLLLLPMRLTRHDRAAPGACVLATVHHVENHAQPALVLADEVADAAALLGWMFRSLRSRWPSPGAPPPELVRLMPLAAGEPLGDAFLAALRQSGWWVQVFASSINRCESTRGVCHADYFERRSANLRSSVRRRRRALERAGRLEIEVVRNGEGLERALLDYLGVTHASWKNPQSMADPLTLAMIRLAADCGGLRLGILRLDGEAIAVQFWLVSGGTAHCMRLAYVQEQARWAPGVVLTDHMLQVVLDEDRVDAIDFGLGDEDYKASWMHDERIYVGLMGFNPRRPRGAWQALRHIGGQAAKNRARRVLQWLGLRPAADGSPAAAEPSPRMG